MEIKINPRKLVENISTKRKAIRKKFALSMPEQEIDQSANISEDAIFPKNIPKTKIKKQRNI